MSVALQVLLLVVAIVVAVAGLGAALALRMSARQQARRGRRPQSPAAAPKPKTGAVVPLASARAAAARRQAVAEAAPPAAPATPLTPEQAHQAKLAALQAMLALGDAQAERAARSGKAHFADTQPADDYPSTEFVDRTDGTQPPLSLLNLDKLPARRRLKT